MVIEYGKIFNLMDTNGRRADVINAFEIYLNILKDAFHNDENYEWAIFPKSLNQYKFYEKSIEESPDVFKSHPQFDSFQEKYNEEIKQFLTGNKNPLIKKISKDDWKILDVAIESRARHYSSNLVKFGFIRINRKITPVGNMFLDKKSNLDKFESILPLTITNIVLLRQLLKLRIYSKEKDGRRNYYSPFLLALYLLQKKDQVSEDDFRYLIQSTSPYFEKQPNQIIDEYFKGLRNTNSFGKLPKQISTKKKLSYQDFELIFKNNKSGSSVEIYWKFYNALFDFKINNNYPNFAKLLVILRNSNWSEKIKKAFGFGKPIFDLGNKNHESDLNIFLEINKQNDLISCEIDDFNYVIFKKFVESKFYDVSIEYSDTTKRIFSASGIIKFDKGICKLAYKDIISEVFDLNFLNNNIFGNSSEEEYLQYEGNDEINYYSSVQSISEIIGMNSLNTGVVINSIENKFKTNITQVKNLIRNKTNTDFIHHINQKYPKKKVLELLKMFDNRSNDLIIKDYVNPEATVPTIYEYLNALAWYYLSKEKFNVYDSLNLTLNADFEPVLHASGGDGDIIVNEKNRVTMLEVTLLNRSSQGRGEMEPVLRHSTNLKAKYLNLETITFFVACELDPNTVNLWRYILTQEQIATLNSTIVKGIIIMSFTNKEICKFIEQEITTDLIIEKTRLSFKNEVPEAGWRENIVKSLINT
jgi:hypothetical protein